MKKRFLAFAFVLCAVLGLMPVSAFADEDDWLESLVSHYVYNEDRHWKVFNLTHIPFDYEEHEFKEEDAVILVTPTCRSEGEILYRCECGYEKKEKLEKSGHSYERRYDEQQHWQECSVCGMVTDNAAHTWDAGTAAVTPTCCTEGERVYSCACGAQRRETIPIGDHAWEFRYDASQHWEECSGCGQKRGFAAHSWGSGVITLSPTCLAEGVMTYTCSCGMEKTEKIERSTHNYVEKFDVYYHWKECTGCGNKENIAEHTWDGGHVTTKPSCTAEGVKTFSCTDCSATKTASVPVSAEHRWDDGKITTPASCFADGVKTYACLDCGTEKTEPIDKATAHSFNSGTVALEPSCEGEGKRVFTCSICGEEKSEAIPAVGHRWTVSAVTREPTEDAPGEKLQTCENCGKKKTTVIPPLNEGPDEEDGEIILSLPEQPIEEPIEGEIKAAPVVEEKQGEQEEQKNRSTLGILLVSVGSAGVIAAAAGFIAAKKKYR